MSQLDVNTDERPEPREELPPAATLSFRRQWGDVAIGTALLGFALWFFVTAGTIEDYSGEAIGAADFPRGIAFLLAIGSLVILVGGLRKLRQAVTDDHLIVVRRYRHVIIGMVMLVGFPALMSLVGFYFAMAPWMAAFLVLAGERRPLHIAAYVAGFLIFTRVIFEMILGTSLP